MKRVPFCSMIMMLLMLLIIHDSSFAQKTIIGKKYCWVEKYSEQNARQYFDSAKELNPIEGIWVGDGGYKYSIEKDYDGYSRNPLRYRAVLISVPGQSIWEVGDIRFFLMVSGTLNLFESTYYLVRASWNKGVRDYNLEAFPCVSVLQGATLSSKVPIFDDYGNVTSNDNEFYYRVYTPVINESKEEKANTWSGTGFAIYNGYIVTNYHVVEDARKMKVRGISGDSNMDYYVETVATDKVNDIAILRITDPNFKGFGTIPYAVQQRMADVGEDVFVLGYPLTQALGNEIKLTNGIISSRTGYQGDIATYQMSAPVQPGNSGGPMFDSKGNVIGIVVAGVPGAENVGYAIKTSYLKILIESAGLNMSFPTNNTVAGLSLSEKVKRVKKFVYYIECSK